MDDNPPAAQEPAAPNPKHAELQERLARLCLELDVLAAEAHMEGLTTLVNTHDGVLSYFHPRWPPAHIAGRYNTLPERENPHRTSHHPNLRFITHEEEAKRWK